MIQLFEEFNESSDQIAQYCDLIKEIDLNQNNFRALQNPNKLEELLQNNDLLKTLNATVFLLLYNLIEATLRSAIAEIYDHLQIQQVSFNDLNMEIKKKVLNDIRDINVENIEAHVMMCLEMEITNASFRPRKLFSGNIDRRVVKDTAGNFGFNTDSNYEFTKHGIDLSDIKNKRNDLAHGNTTFVEVGRSYTPIELEDIALRTVYYLESILKNIKNFIDTKGYLHTP